jgi:excisionase family DNA binding protein
MSNEPKHALTVAATATTTDRWLTIPEAAVIAAMKPNTMYTMCLRRVLESVKIGKMRRIKYSVLVSWMETNTVAARPEI